MRVKALRTQGSRLVAGSRLVEIGEEYRAFFAGEDLADRGTDTVRTAGHERDLPCETEIHPMCRA